MGVVAASHILTAKERAKPENSQLRSCGDGTGRRFGDGALVREENASNEREGREGKGGEVGRLGFGEGVNWASLLLVFRVQHVHVTVIPLDSSQRSIRRIYKVLHYLTLLHGYLLWFAMSCCTRSSEAQFIFGALARCLVGNLRQSAEGRKETRRLILSHPPD